MKNKEAPLSHYSIKQGTKLRLIGNTKVYIYQYAYEQKEKKHIIYHLLFNILIETC